MKILFVSGDVGGARSIMPVVELALGEKHDVTVVKHGHIGEEGPVDWPWLVLNGDEPEDIVSSVQPDAVVFATSVKDRFALQIAKASARAGAMTTHVLDNWSNYARRLVDLDGSRFLPHAYAVMDELALDQAIADGIDPGCLHVTGQPALAGLAAERLEFGGNASSGRRKILFVSEPALGDQGGPQSPKYRGYTEVDVLANFCRFVQPFSDAIEIMIAAHPREDRVFVEQNWLQHAGKLSGGLIGRGDVRESLHASWGIAGMTSILLYEGWLLGKRVISLQPGLRDQGMAAIRHRKGVVFVDQYESLAGEVENWIAGKSPRPLGSQALEMHIGAARQILDITTSGRTET